MVYVDKYGRVWEKGKVVAVRTSEGERKVKDINEADRIIAQERRKAREAGVTWKPPAPEKKESKEGGADTTTPQEAPPPPKKNLIKVFIGVDRLGNPTYREVDADEAYQLYLQGGKEAVAKRFGRAAAERMEFIKDKEGTPHVQYTTPSTERYVTREFIEKVTGKKYKGLKEDIPLWQAKQILKQEGVKYREEGDTLYVETTTTVTKEQQTSKPDYLLTKGSMLTSNLTAGSNLTFTPDTRAEVREGEVYVTREKPTKQPTRFDRFKEDLKDTLTREMPSKIPEGFKDMAKALMPPPPPPRAKVFMEDLKETVGAGVKEVKKHKGQAYELLGEAWLSSQDLDIITKKPIAEDIKKLTGKDSKEIKREVGKGVVETVGLYTGGAAAGAGLGALTRIAPRAGRLVTAGTGAAGSAQIASEAMKRAERNDVEGVAEIAVKGGVFTVGAGRGYELGRKEPTRYEYVPVVSKKGDKTLVAVTRLESMKIKELDVGYKGELVKTQQVHKKLKTQLEWVEDIKPGGIVMREWATPQMLGKDISPRSTSPYVLKPRGHKEFKTLPEGGIMKAKGDKSTEGWVSILRREYTPPTRQPEGTGLDIKPLKPTKIIRTREARMKLEELVGWKKQGKTKTSKTFDDILNLGKGKEPSKARGRGGKGGKGGKQRTVQQHAENIVSISPVKQRIKIPGLRLREKIPGILKPQKQKIPQKQKTREPTIVAPHNLLKMRDNIKEKKKSRLLDKLLNPRKPKERITPKTADILIPDTTQGKTPEITPGIGTDLIDNLFPGGGGGGARGGGGRKGKKTLLKRRRKKEESKEAPVRRKGKKRTVLEFEMPFLGIKVSGKKKVKKSSKGGNKKNKNTKKGKNNKKRKKKGGILKGWL